jgi:hypothetical protein
VSLDLAGKLENFENKYQIPFISINEDIENIHHSINDINDINDLYYDICFQYLHLY